MCISCVCICICIYIDVHTIHIYIHRYNTQKKLDGKYVCMYIYICIHTHHSFEQISGNLCGVVLERSQVLSSRSFSVSSLSVSKT